MKRIASLLLAAATASPVAAEVVVRKVADGSYRSIRVHSQTQSDGTIAHWSRVSDCNSCDFLNVDGDLHGDRAPVYVVIPAGELQPDPSPIVVWARNTGADRDLYFSRWVTGPGWTAPQPVGDGNGGEDTGIDLFLDLRGDVHLVWWSNDEVPGVWYSKFQGGHWSAPELVSDPGRDSRNPVFSSAGGALYINYEDWSLQPSGSICTLKERFDP
jgi:hypothetical protein